MEFSWGLWEMALQSTYDGLKFKGLNKYPELSKIASFKAKLQFLLSNIIHDQTCQQLQNVCSCYRIWANTVELLTRMKNWGRIWHFCEVQNSSFASMLLGVKNCFYPFTSPVTYIHLIFLPITYSLICRNLRI